MGRAQSNRQSTGSNMSQRLPSVTWPPAPTLKHDGRPPRRAPPRRRPRSPQRQPSPAGTCPVTDFWLHGSRNRRRHPLRKSRPPGRRRPYANRRRRHRPGPLRHVDCQSPGLHRTHIRLPPHRSAGRHVQRLQPVGHRRLDLLRGVRPLSGRSGGAGRHRAARRRGGSRREPGRRLDTPAVRRPQPEC